MVRWADSAPVDTADAAADDGDDDDDDTRVLEVLMRRAGASLRTLVTTPEIELATPGAVVAVLRAFACVLRASTSRRIDASAPRFAALLIEAVASSLRRSSHAVNSSAADERIADAAALWSLNAANVAAARTLAQGALRFE